MMDLADRERILSWKRRHFTMARFARVPLAVTMIFYFDSFRIFKQFMDLGSSVPYLFERKPSKSQVPKNYDGEYRFSRDLVQELSFYLQRLFDGCSALKDAFIKNIYFT